MIRPIPIGRPTILSLLMPDVLNTAEDGKDLAAVVLFELAGEAFIVGGTPVGDQPGQSLAVNGPALRSPVGSEFGVVVADFE